MASKTTGSCTRTLDTYRPVRMSEGTWKVLVQKRRRTKPKQRQSKAKQIVIWNINFNTSISYYYYYYYFFVTQIFPWKTMNYNYQFVKILAITAAYVIRANNKQLFQLNKYFKCKIDSLYRFELIKSSEY